jgi:hypothetical protein
MFHIYDNSKVGLFFDEQVLTDIFIHSLLFSISIIGLSANYAV